MLTPVQMKGLIDIQKGFRKIFLRDVDLGETYVMAKRYKDIERITDRGEYIDAVFNEAKNNFGFRKSKIELKLIPSNIAGERIIVNGGADNAFTTLSLNANIDRQEIQEVIHHEFRHFLQDFFAFNQSPKDYMLAINKKIEIMTQGKVKDIWKDLDKFKRWISENLGITGPSPSNIPPDKRLFTIRCLNGTKNYIPAEQNFGAYRRNFLEEDAYKIQAQIKSLLKYINIQQFI